MHDFKFYGTATIGTKGQIVIPAEARDAMGLTEGQKLLVVKGHNHDSLIILKTEALQKMLSKLTSLGSEIQSIAELEGLQGAQTTPQQKS